MARPSSSLDVVRARVRRAQLTVGLGFLALVLGQPLALALMWRIGPRIQAVDSYAVLLVASTLILNLWLLLVLPALCYVVARVIPLRPVPTAVGAALTGEFIMYAIAILSGGVASVLQRPVEVALNLVIATGGVLITMWAIKTALTQKEAAEAEAQKASAQKKNEYDEFAKEAERLAALRDKPAEAPTPASPPPEPPTGGTT